MAHVWIADDVGRWSPAPLQEERSALVDDGVSATDATCASPSLPKAPLIVRRALASSSERWALLCPDADEVYVNGAALALGIHLLKDRDAIRLAGGRLFFFSTEELASVRAFPGLERTVFCPRCKLVIEQGSPAVRCPQCRTWHHQSDDFPCWHYADHCALCDQQTAEDNGYRWSPDDL